MWASQLFIGDVHWLDWGATAFGVWLWEFENASRTLPNTSLEPYAAVPDLREFQLTNQVLVQCLHSSTWVV